MPLSVICPACNEENYGSVLLCKKCQTSLIGVPRQESSAAFQQENEASLNAPVADMPRRETPVQPILPPSNTAVVNGYAAMQAAIRSWGYWSLGLGALHLFTSGFLSAPWGILLILVGLASFYFRSASMFIIYAITLAWAALSNLTSFEPVWIAFALYQFFLAYRVFQQFRLYRNVETEFNAAASPVEQKQASRAPRFFPWMGTLFGCSSIFGLLLMFVIALIIVIGSNGEASIPQFFSFLEGVVVNFGILGASIGLASLLSKYDRKALAIVGLIGGVLTVILEVVLLFAL